jgi:hypothetical protein
MTWVIAHELHLLYLRRSVENPLFLLLLLLLLFLVVVPKPPIAHVEDVTLLVPHVLC